MQNKAILIFPFVDSRVPQYPIGLYKIADYCYGQYEVIVLDERIFKNIDVELQKFLEKNDVLCVGFSVMTGQQIKSAVRLSKMLHGKTKIVWGGCHPTIFASELIREDFIDYIIPGEGEEAFLNLLNHLSEDEKDKNNRTDNYHNSSDYNIFSGFSKRDYIDFNKFPIANEYFIARDGFNRAINLETSRGCPFHCAYCHNSLNKVEYRCTPLDSVKKAIKYLIKNHNIDGIIFQEDILFLNKNRLFELCETLQHLRVGWKANSRIDLLLDALDDQRIIDCLINSGCTLLQLGAESGSNRILSLINKRIDVQKIIDLNKKMRDVPIKIRYNFIVGFPTETIYESELTLNLIEQLQADNKNVISPFVNLYNPYPGTPLYELAIESGFVPPSTLQEWSDVTWNNIKLPWYKKEEMDWLISVSRHYARKSSYLMRDSLNHVYDN